MRYLAPLASGAAVLVLAACAVKPPAPITELDTRACSTAFDLSAATPLVLDAPEAVEIDMGANSHCVTEVNGGGYVYAAFALPASETPYTLTVQSVRVGEAQFAPRALTLDKSGQKLQELPLARFSQRGAALQGTVFVAAQAGERFLVVRSEPGRVGEVRSENAQSVNSTPIVSGGLVFNYMSGAETQLHTTLALNGKLSVRAKRPTAVTTNH